MPLNLQTEESGQQYRVGYVRLYSKDQFKRVFDLGCKDFQELGVQSFPGTPPQRNTLSP